MMKLNKKGITLVEIIVSLGLISIVLIFLLNLFLNVRGTYNSSKIDAEYDMLVSTFVKAIGDDIENYGLLEAEYDTSSTNNSKVIFTFNSFRPTNLSERIVKVLSVELDDKGNYRLSYAYPSDTNNLTAVERSTNTVRIAPNDAVFESVSRIALEELENTAVAVKIPITNSYGTDYSINVYGLLKKVNDDNKNDDEPVNFGGTIMVVPLYYSGELWSQKSNITKVVFENTINSKVGATYEYDISDTKDGSIKAVLVPTEGDSTKYTAYIQANGKIKANKDSSFLFRGFTNLENIEGLENFDTSEVTSMYLMFDNCNSLTTLNLNNFNTSNVTNMYGMFRDCSGLTSLDLSSFDTSNVIIMYQMFYDCSSLISLNISNFDTSKVTNISSLFLGCSSLTSLDVSNFDTSNVTSMYSMFYNCSSLTSLDVSNFNTSKVTDMRRMFKGCSSLTSLNLNNFDTNEVTSMFRMFEGCNSLTSLNLSSFNTSKVTDMYEMFRACQNLTTTITIRGTKCTDYTNMFFNAAINSNAKIIVNYTADAPSLIDNMIATKSTNSNVVKGSIIN